MSIAVMPFSVPQRTLFGQGSVELIGKIGSLNANHVVIRGKKVDGSVEGHKIVLADGAEVTGNVVGTFIDIEHSRVGGSVKGIHTDLDHAFVAGDVDTVHIRSTDSEIYGELRTTGAQYEVSKTTINNRHFNQCLDRRNAYNGMSKLRRVFYQLKHGKPVFHGPGRNVENHDALDKHLKQGK
jgi:hypothetical protein